MNRINGKIVLKESGVGIPDLIVVIFDIDPRTKPEEIIGSGPGDNVASIEVPGRNFAADRLGSIVTNRTGTFEMTYEDDEFRVRNPEEKRPDLFLAVLAPEEIGKDLSSRILFISVAVRQNAGRTEQYFIRLTAAQLEKAGIALPTTPDDEVEEPARIVERLAKANARVEAIDSGFRQIDKERVERVRRTSNGFQTKLKPALRTLLSGVSTTLINPENLVASDESVFEKGQALIQRGIREVINSDDPKVRAPVKGFIALTDEQRQAVSARLGEGGAIEAEALDEILDQQDGRRGVTTFMVREDPLAQLCREMSQEEAHCAAKLESGNAGNGDNPDDAEASVEPVNNGGDAPGRGVEAITGQDINRFVALLMDTMTSPEEQVLSGLEPRADRAKVEEDIRTLSFPPSPADSPAFYDFHNLQIAFEHVWQEVIDEKILDLAEDAYHDIVELGGDPERDREGEGDRVRNPVRALLEEGRIVLTSRREVRDHRTGTIVRDHRGEITVRDHRGEVVVRDHRGKPDRLPPPPGRRPPGSVHLPPHPAERLPEVLAELEQRLKEDYAFTIYAANRKERSVNFAILTTYRQKWEPLAYQAGKLVNTITLAPKETQKYSKKTVLRRKRAEREVENHLRNRREEANQTSRAEQEIIRKASTRTNFSLVANGSLNLPLAGGTSVTTSFEREASKSSDDVKKAFHEAVFKAAQEYKDEHTVEVNTEEFEETEIIESGELTNPNDEIAVTFLFYELQRRYRVTERLHRLTPVILVAQEVPRPDEIDEAWLLSHDWILRRVLLDDSFIPAFNYLAQNIVGEQVALEEMRENITQQRRIVEELRRELGVVRERLLTYRNLLERSLLRKAVDSDGGGFLSRIPIVGDLAEDVVEGIEEVAEDVGELFFGGAVPGQSRQDALKESMQRTADDERDLLFRLEREVTALNAITENYSKALADYLNHKTQVARLRVHIKQNILHYMQAIWSYEPPDQRFFRLHNVPVPILEQAQKTYFFRELNPARAAFTSVPHRRIGLYDSPATEVYPHEIKTEVASELRFTTLAQAADLDNLLGFKGNYMVFSLKSSNALTDYMMEPYVVAGLDELVDPDDLGNWTLDEFARYVCCLKEHLSEEQFESLREQLLQQYWRLLSNPRRNGDVITVPTNSLFIEALPASHSLIEEFKARHRAVDVKKVQAEVREKELENVRAAARILGQQLGDPDIESVKHVFVQSGTTPAINIGDE